ncbi:four helix bundle protein [Sphingobacterium olei]|uniref:Four helix bundle protein n=1 Tax=Sphingobacterium olei TaxID=2571155 RepID=A0A4U0NZ60_9SPHI|nr:four helix bundle protein [Sphingobacterium olei]TJZ60115.1 four helix bundle protein [Sphingobacterium olei]
MSTVSHKDLDVWKKAIVLVSDVYRCTTAFPKEEVYSITSQIRRSAVSIPSNIAEGAARQTNKEFIQFLFIASGSCAELDTQLLIAKNLGYLNEDMYNGLLPKAEEIGKMINGLIKYRKSLIPSL